MLEGINNKGNINPKWNRMCRTEKKIKAGKLCQNDTIGNCSPGKSRTTKEEVINSQNWELKWLLQLIQMIKDDTWSS